MQTGEWADSPSPILERVYKSPASQRGRILFVLWKKNVNFYISRRCAATAGQLSCVTMRCHALVMAFAESTRPTDSGRGSASASPGPLCHAGHCSRRHLGELSCEQPARVCLCVRVCLAGLRGSLSRLQLDYVDIVFANRSDINAPMEGQMTSPPFNAHQ